METTYTTYLVISKDGSAITGVLASETPGSPNPSHRIRTGDDRSPKEPQECPSHWPIPYARGTGNRLETRSRGRPASLPPHSLAQAAKDKERTLEKNLGKRLAEHGYALGDSLVGGCLALELDRDIPFITDLPKYGGDTIIV